MKTDGVQNQGRIFGLGLYVFACWTLLIKYVLPVSWALKQGSSLTQYIYFWDAWWIAHLFVGYGLREVKKGAWIAALLLCLAEIVIITVKFAFYLPNPNFDFWHLNWFINKCFLLVYFWVLLIWLFKKEVRFCYGKKET